ncbi:NAD(P)H-dependent flavin oxidoreductase [Candidatus Gromoviella agglomerans]|uniref:NAD(P)H-dependent flavin oxidoreductase n=1 Tax=Candidatus Gromoviella agglomerans TaxID=2806609 RepID=UPI001E61DCD4|nr:nitronate monooxygenase [Candidatus Gromoviella agglomerans]
MFLKEILISGSKVLPIIEGGKGISISNGITAGYWAAKNGIGTFSGVNGDVYDEMGNLLKLIYKGKTRKERHEELIAHGIKAGIAQAKIAHDISNGNGRIHMNVLWEMADVKRVLNGILTGTKGLIHGITCGAGMPYELSKIAAQFKVFYYPIVSSARAFNILWQRAYKDVSEWLGGVVYEDPWKAGGHNGLSRKEDSNIPQDPYERVAELRESMKNANLDSIPIIMAGNVWRLKEWESWIDNAAIGQIGFQFGTRPLLTKESPIPDLWKRRLLEVRKGETLLHKFSPTGFHSSAVYNDFLKNLVSRSSRQIAFLSEKSDEFCNKINIGLNDVFITDVDYIKSQEWASKGFTKIMKTPDKTIIFTTPSDATQIRRDQISCMGCLSQCKFSNWSQEGEAHTTGLIPDPRSFCIQKTLQYIVHADEVCINGFSIKKSPQEIANHIKNAETFMSQQGNNVETHPLIDLHYELASSKTVNVSLEESYNCDTSAFDDNLMFSGHSVYRFSEDELYYKIQDGKKIVNIPTISELVDTILMGN